jgi:hypothetical protein
VARGRKQICNLNETVRQPSVPGDRQRSIRGAARSSLARAAILLAVFAILTVAYRVIGRTISYNSDNACILLQAQDLAAGNFALRGWTLSNCSFYPEICFYALASVMSHSARALSHQGPALMYALLVIFALWLTGHGSIDSAPYAGYAITFLLIGFPTTLPHLYIAPATHVSTILLILAAMVALSFAEEGSSRSPAPYIAYTLLLAFAVFGDAFAIYVGAIPVAVVAAFRWARSRFLRHRELAALAATVAAVLVGSGSLRLVRDIGGFELLPLVSHFVTVTALRGNASAIIGGIATLYGVDAGYGALTPLDVMLLVARSVGLLFLLGCCALSAYRIMWGAQDRTTEIVLAAALLDVIEYLLSNRVRGLDTARYLLPFVMFGAVLAGRIGGKLIRPNRLYYSAIALIFIAYLFGFVRIAAQQPQSPQKETLLAQWLHQRGLVSGYGDYWQSSIVTLESDGAVKVRAVTFAGRLVPYRWESKEEWYSADSRWVTPNFVVFFEEPKKFKNIFKMVSAIRTLGKPSQTYQFEGDMIMVWDHGKWLLK